MSLKDKILDRAQKFIQKGYLDKAIAEYKAAVDVDPRDISIRLRIGDLYVKTGRKADAIKEYTEVAKANTQRGFYLKAIAVYKQVLKLDETNIDIHYKLAELYTRQRLIADAISEYSFIVSTMERKGKVSDVLDIVKKMAEVDPENIGVRLKLADLFQRLGFDKDALAEYASIFGRLLGQGQLDKAEKIYLNLYNSKPKEPEVSKGLSDLYRRKGDQAQFLRFAKNLFYLYKDSSETDKAKEVCKSILEVKPDDAEAVRFFKSLEAHQPGPQAPEPLKSPKAEVAAPPAPPSVKPPPEPAVEAPLIEFPQIGIEARPEVKEAPAAPSVPPGEEEIEISLEGFEEIEIKEMIAEEHEAGKKPSVEVSARDIEIEIEAEAAAPVEAPAAPGAEPEVRVEEAAEPMAEEPASAPPEIEAEEEIALEIKEEAEAEEVKAEAKEEVREEALVSVEAVEAVKEAQAEAAGEERPEDINVEFMEEEAPVISAPPELEALEKAREEERIEEAGAAETPEEVTPAPPVEAQAPYKEEGVPPSERIEEAVEEALEAAEAPAEAPQAGVEEGLKAEEAERPAETMEAPEAYEEARPEEVQEDLSSAISELMEKIEPAGEPSGAELAGPSGERLIEETVSEEKAPSEAPPEEAGEEYVDLSAELGMKEALEDLAGTFAEESKETFDEFKKGIGKQLIKEDSETHYNLGIAYMEMELYSEAEKEFKIALKDPRLEFDCYTRLGHCSRSQNNPDEAIVYYLKALKIQGRTEDERKGMMYELALAYEAAGEKEEALQLFQSIYDSDPGYRDAAKKVGGPVAVGRPLIPLDDGMIEVELL